MRFHNSLKALQSDSEYAQLMADQIRTAFVAVDLRTLQYSIQLTRDLLYAIALEKPESTHIDREAIAVKVFSILFPDLDSVRLSESISFIQENSLAEPRSLLLRLYRFVSRFF